MDIDDSMDISISPKEKEEEIIEVEENNYSFSSEDEKISFNNKKGTKLHTIKSKIKIVSYAEKHSIKEAVIKYNIPRTTLNDCVKNKNKFLSLDSDKLKKTTMHKGGKPINNKIEDQLISFIEFNRKLNNPITTYSIFIKLLELWPERKNISKETNYVYIYRVLVRHCYTFRTPSHYGQTLKKSAFIDASLFLNEIKQNRITGTFVL